MTEEELIKFLKENLKLEVYTDGGDYGSSRFLIVKLSIEDNIIYDDSIYLD